MGKPGISHKSQIWYFIVYIASKSPFLYKYDTLYRSSCIVLENDPGFLLGCHFKLQASAIPLCLFSKVFGCNWNWSQSYLTSWVLFYWGFSLYHTMQLVLVFPLTPHKWWLYLIFPRLCYLSYNTKICLQLHLHDPQT